MLFLGIGLYHRYHRGLLPRIDEHLAVFLVCWLVLVPFVTFQALLCARDDAQIQNACHGSNGKDCGPSAMATVSPLLIVVGWLVVSAIGLTFRYRTAYQVLFILIFVYYF
jgi:hypothetical protein